MTILLSVIGHYNIRHVNVCRVVHCVVSSMILAMLIYMALETFPSKTLELTNVTCESF